MEKKKIIKFIFVISIIILLISIFLPLKIKKNELIQQKQKQRETVKQLTKENISLREELKLLKESPDYVEEVARRELGLIKKSEIIFRQSFEEETE